MKQLWRYDYSERNGDNPRLNDLSTWSIKQNEEGHTFLSVQTNNDETHSIQVKGDLERAKKLLTAELERKHRWPSYWLDPTCCSDEWHNELDFLELEFVGAPFCEH